MSNIQSLIEMLQGDNPNKRYDACEELRVSPQPLPQEVTCPQKLYHSQS